MDAHKFHTAKKFGPGGPKCSCCNWGKDANRKAHRAARKALKLELKNITIED